MIDFRSSDEHEPPATKYLDERVVELGKKYDQLISLANAQRETLNGQKLAINLSNDLKEMDHWIHTKLNLLER